MSKQQNDHFVPKTYLQRFVDPTRQNLLHVYRKQDHGYACQKPRKVCRERGGDENPYYRDPRILRSLLGEFEPKWSAAVDSFIADPGDGDAQFVIAGLAAYLMSWVPASRRIQTDAMEQQMEAMRPMFAKQVKYDIEDMEEATKTAEALLDKRIMIKVDTHFPRAIALQNMLSIAVSLFEGRWLFSRAPEGKHFITSDNPAVKLHLSNADLLGKTFLPLDPLWAVVILPAPKKEGDERDPTKLTSTGVEVVEMGNEVFESFTALMVKSAERVVISSRDDQAVHELVKEYSDWRMEAQLDRMPKGLGSYLITSLRPARKLSN